MTVIDFDISPLVPGARPPAAREQAFARLRALDAAGGPDRPHSNVINGIQHLTYTFR